MALVAASTVNMDVLLRGLGAAENGASLDRIARGNPALHVLSSGVSDTSVGRSYEYWILLVAFVTRLLFHILFKR